MSIINDALKKTQSEFQNKDGKNPTNVYEKFYQNKKNQLAPDDPKAAKREEAPRRKSSAGKVFLILFLFVLAGVVTVRHYPNIPRVLMHKAKSLKIASTSTTPYVPPPVKRTIPEGAIILNGVMLMDDRHVALINDDVYEVGDYINGKKIVNITLEQVDFLQNGRIESYKVRHK